MRDFPHRRRRMVALLREQGIRDLRVLEALETVPRHRFVPEALHERAYGEFALPIGNGQSISKPYTVARMLEVLELRGPERVLEIGTGSGYQAAVLSRLARRVYTMERIHSFVHGAQRILEELGCRNVLVREADGTLGWKEQGPFDAIVVAAGGPRVPEALLEQLGDGGRLVAPIGGREGQALVVVQRRAGKTVWRELERAHFVDLIGMDGWRAADKAEAR
jgi:protein-L-isoaspartate(D-aspartate) O-methyltransferase